MSLPPQGGERFGAAMRARGLDPGAALEAIRPNLESLLARLRSLGDRLPPEAAPPPGGPAAAPR